MASTYDLGTPILKGFQIGLNIREMRQRSALLMQDRRDRFVAQTEVAPEMQAKSAKLWEPVQKIHREMKQYSTQFQNEEIDRDEWLAKMEPLQTKAQMALEEATVGTMDMVNNTVLQNAGNEYVKEVAMPYVQTLSQVTSAAESYKRSFQTGVQSEIQSQRHAETTAMQQDRQDKRLEREYKLRERLERVKADLDLGGLGGPEDGEDDDYEGKYQNPEDWGDAVTTLRELEQRESNARHLLKQAEEGSSRYERLKSAAEMFRQEREEIEQDVDALKQEGVIEEAERLREDRRFEKEQEKRSPLMRDIHGLRRRLGVGDYEPPPQGEPWNRGEGRTEEMPGSGLSDHWLFNEEAFRRRLGEGEEAPSPRRQRRPLGAGNEY